MAIRFWVAVSCALMLSCCTAQAETLCHVEGLGEQLSNFRDPGCEGRLTPDEAIDCVNYLAEQVDERQLREEKAIAQAECLCTALNEIVGGIGRYSRLTGSCSVER